MPRLLRAVAVVVLLALLRPPLGAAPTRPLPVPAKPRPVSFLDRLLPAPVDGGFRQDGYWVWCGTVVKGDDGLYHGAPSPLARVKRRGS